LPHLEDAPGSAIDDGAATDGPVDASGDARGDATETGSVREDIPAAAG